MDCGYSLHTVIGDRGAVMEEGKGRETQSPFRDIDLLPVDEFLKYCWQHRVRAFENDLEYYEKEALLFPAVRVFYTVADYQSSRADLGRSDQPSLEPVAVSALNDLRSGLLADISNAQEGWLSRYSELGLVAYPCQEKSRPWSEYKIPAKPRSSKENIWQDWPPKPPRTKARRKSESFPAETLYSRLQMYPLAFVRSTQTTRIRNDGLTRPSREWIQFELNTSDDDTLCIAFHVADRGADAKRTGSRRYPAIRGRLSQGYAEMHGTGDKNRL